MRTTLTLIMLLFFCGCDRKTEMAYAVDTHETASHVEFKILSWNVESGRNSPQVIAEQLEAFSGCGIVALQEVQIENEARYTTALGESKKSLISKFGKKDRIMIAYDTTRFELLSSSEPLEYQGHKFNDGTYRSPLIAVFRDQASGNEFTFLAVHLERRSAKLRDQQAIALRELARHSEEPMIVVGDFNMDYDFPTEKGNSSFDEMLRDDVWSWAKPDPLVDTNWADRNRDGKDDYPDSMLDFCFIAKVAKDWSVECDVIVRKGDFPDNKATSDHRPIEITVRIPVLRAAKE